MPSQAVPEGSQNMALASGFTTFWYKDQMSGNLKPSRYDF
jgi:hypothetical protein